MGVDGHRAPIAFEEADRQLTVSFRCQTTQYWTSTGQEKGSNPAEKAKIIQNAVETEEESSKSLIKGGDDGNQTQKQNR